MIHGHFIDRDNDSDAMTITSCESIAQRLDGERLKAPRVLTAAEVNERLRIGHAILNERIISAKEKERLADTMNDLLCCIVAMRKEIAATKEPK